LTGASPARGTGVVVPGLTEDFDGVKRPTNSPNDIGAFQIAH
jgi:hypothetical protein